MEARSPPRSRLSLPACPRSQPIRSRPIGRSPRSLKRASAPNSPHAGAIDSALAAVPRAVAPKDFGALEALGADSWRLCSAHEDGPPRDLFVEAPEGWWLKTAPAHADGGRDCFTLTIGDKPKDAAYPVALRLT